ncbi:hypothetical protein GGR56DRAFT_298875 [Xylariaceae sp. FL0804]|nr:hypothetical protein GGR56DRAFT_298875 [Xylariaceae sp. FL0804]
MLGFPELVSSLLLGQVYRLWPSGIKSVQDKPGRLELHLNGTPWAGRASNENLNSTAPVNLMSYLLEALFNIGWLFENRTQIFETSEGKDVLIFRCVGAQKHRDWLSIDTYPQGGLTLMGGPSDLIEPLRRLVATQRVTIHSWPSAAKVRSRIRGLARHRGSQTTEKRMQAALELLSLMEQRGWSLYAAIKQAGSDTWHFCRERDNVPDGHESQPDFGSRGGRAEMVSTFEEFAESHSHDDEIGCRSASPVSLL